jgi:adenylate cyclase
MPDAAPALLPPTDAVRARADALIGWLLGPGVRQPALREADFGETLRGVCERLAAAGMPLRRCAVLLQTYHPQFSGLTRTWVRGRGLTEQRGLRRGDGPSPFVGSPMQLMVETGDWVIRRLDACAASEREMFAELQAEGYTHYALAPLKFSTGTNNGISFATDSPDGFSPDDLGLLAATLPTLTLAIEMKAVRRISNELLSAYVGEAQVDRILLGTVRIGDLTRMEAAIMTTDLRGFTPLADRLGEDVAVLMLNAYFDCVVPAIRSNGGEILKFVGDGVLAIFPDERLRSARRACRAALAAAREAHATLDVLNGAPSPWSATLAMGVALHHGQVVYGNIGSGDRVDFTVIGRDVNLASRIERLCGELGEPTLMSRAFARRIDDLATARGSHLLKGIETPQDIYVPTTP